MKTQIKKALEHFGGNLLIGLTLLALFGSLVVGFIFNSSIVELTIINNSKVKISNLYVHTCSKDATDQRIGNLSVSETKKVDVALECVDEISFFILKSDNSTIPLGTCKKDNKADMQFRIFGTDPTNNSCTE